MDATRETVPTGIDGLEIRPFDPGAASGNELRAFWKFWMWEWSEVYPEDPETPFEKWLAGFRNSSWIRESKIWALWSGEAVRGDAWVEIPGTGLDPNGASVAIRVHPELHRRGLGSRLLAGVTSAAEEKGRRILRLETLDRYPSGAAFCRAIGAVAQSVTHTNRLLMTDVDPGIVSRWLELPDDRSDLEITEWRNGPPDERLDEMSALYQEIYDAEPDREGFERGTYHFTPEYFRQFIGSQMAAGASILTVAASSRRDGSILGCTEITWNPARPAVVNQMFTGVRPASRGHGLARRLKAEMFTRIRREHPGVVCIRSANDDDNPAINRINTELGYHPWIARTNWHADVAIVRKYLDHRRR
ncbi:MAG: GNAT family N-acetyltransferase [Candidatus Fermentibacter sp.]|nr:GNAT family N-acetyltransferase [Candidatus Fermentibacter sp.]